MKKVENFLYEDLTYKIRGAVFEVYRSLGSGHKESVYQKALARGLKGVGIDFEREVRIKVFYQGENVGTYTPDFVIDEKIILELKAKPVLHKDDIQQFWQYLRGTEYKLGLLVNFGSFPKVEIIRRVH